MLPTYEEKTFESYFNVELDQRSEIYFPFGQVQEGGIGADAAAMSRHPGLWKILGYRYYSHRFAGEDLRIVADDMERLLRHEIRNIPSIKANLLFQYKRPEIITTSRGAEWRHWKQRYFRYEIYSKQQKLLEHLDGNFGSKALIIYASPAIGDINDLVQAKLSGKIIETTNFCRASSLRGHHRNTYIRSGLHSIACSAPEELPSFDLLTRLEQLEAHSREQNLETILEFTSLMRGAIEDSFYLRGSYRALIAPFEELHLSEFRLLFAHISMGVIRDLTGIQWLVAIGKR